MKYIRRGFKSILDGMASLVIFPSPVHRKEIDEILSRSDADALRSDWEAVGGDMLAAIAVQEKTPHSTKIKRKST